MGKITLVIGFVGSALLPTVPLEAASRLFDTLDEFTDERQLGILLAPTAEFEAGFFFMCDIEKRQVFVGSGESSMTNMNPATDLTMPINVRLRFDVKPAVQQTWRGVTNFATKRPASDLLDEAIASARLIIQIGYGDILRFDLAEARNNLMEFERRCAEEIQPKPHR